MEHFQWLKDLGAAVAAIAAIYLIARSLIEEISRRLEDIKKEIEHFRAESRQVIDLFYKILQDHDERISALEKIDFLKESKRGAGHAQIFKKQEP